MSDEKEQDIPTLEELSKVGTEHWPDGESSLAVRTGSDFGRALLEQHMIVMTTLGRTCRMNGGDLKDPAVLALIDKADALDRVAELWGIELNPNSKITNSDPTQTT